MEITTDVQDDAAAVRAAVAAARRGLVDREVLAEVVVLCAVAGEHLRVGVRAATCCSRVVAVDVRRDATIADLVVAP